MGDGPKVEDRRNTILLNEKDRSFIVKIFDEGEDAAVKALGSLEMAKDVVKAHLTEWRIKDAQRRGLIVPAANGKAGLSVH